MDLNSIIGLIVGFGLIVYGILDGGALANFISLGSLVIVLGGTIGAILIAFPMKQLKSVVSSTKFVFGKSQFSNYFEYIDKLSEMAVVARTKGVLALEDVADEIDDDYLKDAINLIVDAVESAKLIQILEDKIECIEERHYSAISVFEKAAEYAPAFGMIGTLIGLINMMSSMSLDGGADALVKGMAVALITTLYGTVFANLIFAPMASKLKIKHNEEMISKQLIIKGVISIQKGENPQRIKENLYMFLTKKEVIKYTDSASDDDDDYDDE